MTYEKVKLVEQQCGECENSFMPLYRNSQKFCSKRCGGINWHKDNVIPKTDQTNPLPWGESAFNSLYSKYCFGAKRRGYEFHIEKEDFRIMTKQNCTYCNSEPWQVQKSACETGDYIYTGLDRVDNKQGYELENCVPCCKICNTMKMEMSEEDFLKHINKITNFRFTHGILDPIG